MHGAADQDSCFRWLCLLVIEQLGLVKRKREPGEDGAGPINSSEASGCSTRLGVTLQRSLENRQMTVLLLDNAHLHARLK